MLFQKHRAVESLIKCIQSQSKTKVYITKDISVKEIKD